MKIATESGSNQQALELIREKTADPRVQFLLSTSGASSAREALRSAALSIEAAKYWIAQIEEAQAQWVWPDRLGAE